MVGTTYADHTSRFTDHAEYYAAFRPAYPGSVWERLASETDLNQDTVIVDAGSGTGLSSELFLRHGHTVIGIEPNPDMRRIGNALLRHYPRFRGVNGRAEATTLRDRSADMIVCASSFHWFDPIATRREFERILRPGGLVVVMSHRRRRDGSQFLLALDRILRRYAARTPERERLEDNVRAFFGAHEVLPVASFDQTELLDYTGLKGRLLSYSSMPLPGHKGYDPMVRRLRELFQRGAPEGSIRFESRITLRWARLD